MKQSGTAVHEYTIIEFDKLCDNLEIDSLHDIFTLRRAYFFQSGAWSNSPVLEDLSPVYFFGKVFITGCNLAKSSTNQ